MVRRRRLIHTEPPATARLVSAVETLSRPLRSAADLDPLLDRIGDARYVLLGEASHGTHEYYAWRATISRRLIKEKGFSFIAVEGDWPDCYRVNRYAKGDDDAGDSARDVLHAFDRWPTWMWANEEVAGLIEWLRGYNDFLPEDERVGFYGLDVYSLWDSLYQVAGFLRKHAPEALPAARQVFQCFEPYGEEAQEYARTMRWLDESCEAEAVALLANLDRILVSAESDGREARFNAAQNALVVKDAEAYYRTMVRAGAESWNLRERHMTETLERLMHHHGDWGKAIVWAHNTHVGDARYTDMADDGMVNIGQLVREKHAEEGVMLVGFSSYEGSVIAGADWDAPAERMEVPPGRRGSWEEVLHRAGPPADRLLLFAGADTDECLVEERGQRAIGVVYQPGGERHGNYVPTVLPRRYDALLYLDETRALNAFQDVTPRVEGEVPETYPTGV